MEAAVRPDQAAGHANGAPKDGYWPPRASLSGGPVVPVTPRKPPLGQLMTRVVADVGGLVLDEARLARAEASANVRSLGRATGFLAAGGLLLGLAIIFVTVAAIVALAQVIGLLWALLAVTLGCVVLGVLLLTIGKGKIASVSLLPEGTLSRMGADLRWLADRAEDDGPLEKPKGETHG